MTYKVRALKKGRWLVRGPNGERTRVDVEPGTVVAFFDPAQAAQLTDGQAGEWFNEALDTRIEKHIAKVGAETKAKAAKPKRKAANAKKDEAKDAEEQASE